MKRIVLWIISFLPLPVLLSCGSIKSIGVETCHPAAVTFPPGVKTLMLVNNAAQQPDGVGHRYIRSHTEDSTLSVPTGGMAKEFCVSLGRYLADAPVFHDVRICEDTLRRDSVFYDPRPFSAHRVAELCEGYGVDGLISLERMFFITDVFESRPNDHFVGNSIHLQIRGELRALWPSQQEVYAFPFSDSLKWYGTEADDAWDFLAVAEEPDVQEAMRYLLEVVAEKMQRNFVPYWSSEYRWYYTEIASGWKRGSAYADAGKWEEALAAWELLLPATTKPRARARLYANMALCHEMTGDFEKAMDCAEQSVRLFRDSSGEESDYTKLQDRYVEVLKERAGDERLLSRQLRENN
jgi:hypothetical protein